MSAGPCLDPSLIHILEIVFRLPSDSALHKALHGNMYSAPEDYIIEVDDIVDSLAFRGDDRKVTRILPAGSGLLKTF